MTYISIILHMGLVFEVEFTHEEVMDLLEAGTVGSLGSIARKAIDRARI